MTVGGYVLFGVLALVFLGAGAGLGYSADDEKGAIIGSIFGLFLSILLFIGMSWWYNNTASGSRALKSQESNFNNGIERRVEVYDATGNLIKTYEGKFDIEYDDDRILFDDENGLRHVIYYPTGTVIVDEIGK